MANRMIEVQGLSKMYRLGEINTGSLSHDLSRWVSKLRGRQDPYQQIAGVNDRASKPASGYVWSLRDINFTVNEGDVFGVIGKNGAGKSTLLKLLSKITQPTGGSISLAGRVSSLLEVGTGFHPDLSGRENVYLNGAILGMRKQEIKQRFDEIVDFSGIGNYIDTPVKRYSSGMFVRLAFAVAAHLEPEILVVDEVLAVGDAEFQQKCIGKMKDVSQRQGRTILFVSHNIAAIKQLCNRAMLLEHGESKLIGPVEKVLEAYQEAAKDQAQGFRSEIPEGNAGYFVNWYLLGKSAKEAQTCFTREPVTLTCSFHCVRQITNCEFHIRLTYDDGLILLHNSSTDFSGRHFTMEPGDCNLHFRLELPVRQGNYRLEMGLMSLGKWIDIWSSSTLLRVLDNFEGHSRDVSLGILNVKTRFSYEEINRVYEQV